MALLDLRLVSAQLSGLGHPKKAFFLIGLQTGLDKDSRSPGVTVLNGQISVSYRC